MLDHKIAFCDKTVKCTDLKNSGERDLTKHWVDNRILQMLSFWGDKTKEIALTAGNRTRRNV